MPAARTAAANDIDQLRVGEAAPNGRSTFATVGIAPMAAGAAGAEIPPAGVSGGLCGENRGKGEQQCASHEGHWNRLVQMTLAMGGALLYTFG